MLDFWKLAEKRLLKALQRTIALPRTTKFALILSLDAVLCLLAVWIAFSLRLGEWHLWNGPVVLVLMVSLGVWLPVFLMRGIYQSILRFMGARTMGNIAASCFIMAAITSLIYTLHPIAGVPRTIGAIHAIVFAMLLVVGRLVGGYLLSDLLNQRRYAGQLSRVLIYGAGTAGRQLALSLRHEPGMALQGFIDDDDRLSGQRLDGVPIYPGEGVCDLISRLDVDTVLLAVPRLSRQRREAIVRKFENASVHVLTLPAVGDLVDGKVSIADLREVDITDLLGRDPVPPNHLLLHKTIAGRSVMVTGAGGSIGSELCRQIAELHPSKIVLVDMTEHALYMIEDELRSAKEAGRIDASISIHAELGSVAEPGTVRRLFDKWRPDTVFHAAAYKHVPLVEENVIAGMRNNIWATLYCALESERVGVGNFILVSTDKAVRPTNVMGATKRACELVLQALAARGARTRFAMVRFGNVLGSSGSVVPRFQRQIREGGPVTLTHREVTRYFMSIPEAAQLVIQAGAMAEGGEVYVLDMGQPIQIYELARTMINLSGLTVRDANNPEGDIEILEVGLRKGEKLYEELLIGNSPQPTHHPRIMRAREDYLEWTRLETELQIMDRALEQGDRSSALRSLSKLVPEFDGEQSFRLATA
jgi:FlaA1/EpsC-like NDP-sugar epimerase